MLRVLRTITAPRNVVRMFRSRVNVRSFYLQVTLVRRRSRNEGTRFPSLFCRHLRRRLNSALTARNDERNRTISVRFTLLHFQVRSHVVSSRNYLDLLSRSLTRQLRLYAIMERSSANDGTLTVNDRRHVTMAMLTVLRSCRSFRRLIRFHRYVVDADRILTTS